MHNGGPGLPGRRGGWDDCTYAEPLLRARRGSRPAASQGGLSPSLGGAAEAWGVGACSGPLAAPQSWDSTTRSTLSREPPHICNVGRHVCHQNNKNKLGADSRANRAVGRGRRGQESPTLRTQPAPTPARRVRRFHLCHCHGHECRPTKPTRVEWARQGEHRQRAHLAQRSSHGKAGA